MNCSKFYLPLIGLIFTMLALASQTISRADTRIRSTESATAATQPSSSSRWVSDWISIDGVANSTVILMVQFTTTKDSSNLSDALIGALEYAPVDLVEIGRLEIKNDSFHILKTHLLYVVSIYGTYRETRDSAHSRQTSHLLACLRGFDDIQMKA